MSAKALISRVSFRNFRRFEDFPSCEIGNINVLVGPNNSGKSTFIKALILILKNLGNTDYDDVPLSKFRFSDGSNAYMHLGDFRSNLHRYSRPDSMEFEIEIGGTILSFCLDGVQSGYEESSTTVPLKCLQVRNSSRQQWFSYAYCPDGTCMESYYFSDEEIDHIVSALQEELDGIASGIRIFADSEAVEGDWHLSHIDRLVKDKQLISETLSYIQNQKILGIKDDEGYYCIKNVCYPKDFNHGLASRNDSLPMELKIFRKKARKSYSHDLFGTSVVYIDTHSASHNEILFRSDHNNYLAETVGLFQRTGLSPDNIFVVKWLKNFRIGEDFRVVDINSEAYKVEILKNGDWYPLGMMGTGAIQLFILLLRSAAAMAAKGFTAMFIEEPEQNLHPAFQSRLADLLYDINMVSDGKVQLFVETHSEYLVRRFQVIVAESIRSRVKNSVALNDEIKVYYFPDEECGQTSEPNSGLPYSMVFRYDGHFEEKFGHGFYDEASESYLALIK